jgi:hypothetical protein
MAMALAKRAGHVSTALAQPARRQSKEKQRKAQKGMCQ